MALTPMAITMIKDAAALALLIKQEIKPRLDMFNVQYDAQDALKSTIQQADLDEVIELSGLTKAELDDAMYVLTNGIKGVVDASTSQLSKLAARGVLKNNFKPF